MELGLPLFKDIEDEYQEEDLNKCPCGCQPKLQEYTQFIQNLAHTLGVTTSIDKLKKTAYLRGVNRFDVIEQARSILMKFGDFDGDFKH